MIRPQLDSSPFRLRAANIAAEGSANSSVLRVARHATAARAAPVLQRTRAPRQLAFDFYRGGR
jgi:hypothetical protein